MNCLRAKTRIVLVLFFAAAPLLAQEPDRKGIIRGVVQDSSQRPVAAARVKAFFTGAFSGIMPGAKTDAAGRFVITGLWWGGYHITASKEEEGYPDQSNAFYAGWNSDLVNVELDSNHPDETVTVHLGQKGGVIFGSVTDAETGKPIEPCAELRWKMEPKISWSGAGLITSNFRLLAPADTEFTMMLWGRGYEPWFYRNEDGGDSILVKADQKLRIDAKLIPNGEGKRPQLKTRSKPSGNRYLSTGVWLSNLR